LIAPNSGDEGPQVGDAAFERCVIGADYAGSRTVWRYGQSITIKEPATDDEGSFCLGRRAVNVGQEKVHRD
jgi:hypothetical protein